MNWDEMNQAVEDAKKTISRADLVVGQMAAMAAGRLRKANVSYSTLCALKRELSQYDMTRGRWKSRPL